MIKKLNNYFICGEDEKSTTSDMFFFYGISTFMVIISIIMIAGLLKG